MGLTIKITLNEPGKSEVLNQGCLTSTRVIKMTNPNSKRMAVAFFILVALVIGLSGYSQLATIDNSSFTVFLMALCLPVSLLSSLAFVLINGGD